MEVWTVHKSLPFDHCSSETYMYQGFYFLPVIVIGHTDKHFQLFQYAIYRKLVFFEKKKNWLSLVELIARTEKNYCKNKHRQ